MSQETKMNAEARSDADKEKIERGWAERGWPADLLAAARRVHISDDQILRMFAWNAVLRRVEEEVAWAEKLWNGTIRFRQLTVADNEAFCELWANSPEEIGDWDVTVERGPNGFAQFELQERPTLNGLFDGGVMVACVSFSLRHTVVDGQRLSVRYGQAMRVHKDHRGKQYAHWVRSLPWAIGINMYTRVQYDYIRAHNMTMEKWNRNFMPEVSSVPKREGEVPGIPVTVQQFTARASHGAAAGIRRARVEDLPACAALINRTHEGLDLFRPYTAEWLVDRLLVEVPPNWPAPPPYCIDDFRVVDRGGAIVACAGLWDRGRDVRERWRHRESGAERVVAATALLDIGYAEGAAEALADLIENYVGRTHELGRDYLVAPLGTLPDVAALLSGVEAEPETRYLQWRAETPPLQPPAHLDLVYW
jgi:hypothetical protein